MSKKVVKGTCCVGHSQTLDYTVVDNIVTDVRVSKEDPWYPYACAKLKGIPQLLNEWRTGPQRLRHPLKRVGGKLEETTWDDALEITARKLLEIREEYGPQSVVILPYTGYFFNLFNRVPTDWWRARYGTPNMLCVMECYVPRYVCQVITFGDPVPPDICGNPRCVIVWAGNPAETSPYNFSYIMKLKKEGKTKLIVADPRRTRTARGADIHLQLRPTTDAALALGMLNVIISEGLYDREFVEKYTLGFYRLAERVKDYPPEKVEKITLVPSNIIKEAARSYATTKPAAIMFGVSVDNYKGGSSAKFAVHALMAITGNVDVEGGQVPVYLHRDQFSGGSPEIPHEGLGFADYPMVRGRFWDTALHAGFIQAAEEGNPYPVKAFICLGGNPAVQFPNQNRLRKLLDKMFVMQVDIVKNDTTEFADIVLPATMSVEQEGPDMGSWQFFSYEPVVKYSHKIVDPPADAEVWPEWRIFIELTKKMGYQPQFETLDGISKSMDGFYMVAGWSKHGLTMESLKKNPVGWWPRDLIGKARKEGFRTPSGKIELCPSGLEEYGYDPLPSHHDNPATPEGNPDLAKDYPLIFITSRVEAYWASRWRDFPAYRKLSLEPTLDMNAEDARKYGIADGDVVVAESPRGSVTVKARITEEVPLGVSNLTVGWSEANANFLTDDENPDPVTDGQNLKQCLIRVRKKV